MVRASGWTIQAALESMATDEIDGEAEPGNGGRRCDSRVAASCESGYRRDEDRGDREEEQGDAQTRS